MKNKILKNKILIPLLVLAFMLFLFGFNAFNYYQLPVISSISPEVAYPGEYIEIKGTNFGKTQTASEVRIAGKRPLSTSYKIKTDTKIVVKVPDDSGSGMVIVKTPRGSSNGVLFTNKEHIPVILKGPQKPGYPYIESIEPESGNVGEIVRIKGLNFGHDRDDSAVFFAGYAFEDQKVMENSTDEMIECSEKDYDYNSWGEQEITVYIPDGASSGNIKILTDRGISNAIYFEIIGSPGKKNFGDKMGVQLEYGITISNASGNPVNGLDLWVPKIRNSLEQRNVESIIDPEPLWADYLGLMRYHIDNLTPETNFEIVVNSWLERYNIETSVNPERVSNNYNKDRMLYKVYTSSEKLIPSDNKLIVQAASNAIRNEKNPYLKAYAIYNYLLDNLNYTTDSKGQEVVESLSRGSGDSYTYSILFSAMCRAVNIPARPVAGILIYDNKQSERHYWADFYIEEFGWIPVDPSIGDGARFGDLPMNEETTPKDYYFGNIDNHHIAFTKGIIPVKKIEQDGKLSNQKTLYSLQTIYEESTGLEKYNSYWKPVRVVNWW